MRGPLDKPGLVADGDDAGGENLGVAAEARGAAPARDVDAVAGDRLEQFRCLLKTWLPGGGDRAARGRNEKHGRT